MKLYSRQEFLNEGLIDTLKGTLPDISLRSNVNFWPSIIDDIKSGKLKGDALSGLLPTVIDDIKSGKLKDDALSGLLPTIIDDIKSGKLKDDAIKNFPPAFVNDVKSGKITKAIIGEKPEILSKITNMFI